MFNLIMKDIKITFNKKTLAFCIVYFVAYGYVFSDNFIKGLDMIFLIGTLFILSSIISIFTIDEKYRWNTIINSLPIEKSKIVFARYLSVFAYMILLLSSIWVAVFILNTFNLISIELFTINNLKKVLNMISMIFICTSIVYPIYFKYRIKTNVFIRIFIFSIVGFLGFISCSIEKFSVSKISIISLISLCMFIISYLISVKFYTNVDMD